MFSALNGFGLSLVIPSCQSMIADYYPAKDRGKAFGILYMMCSLGSLIGGILATNLGGRQAPLISRPVLSHSCNIPQSPAPTKILYKYPIVMQLSPPLRFPPIPSLSLSPYPFPAELWHRLQNRPQHIIPLSQPLP